MDDSELIFPTPYKDLYNQLPGFAYQSRIVSRDSGGLYNLSLQVASEGCHELLGLTAEQMIGRNSIERLLVPEDLSLLRNKTAEAINDNVPIVLYYRVIPAGTGSIKWVREQTRCAYDEKHRPLHTEGFITDVSTEKLYELKLEEENKKLRALHLSSAEIGTFVGRSAKMRYFYDELRIAAQSDANVILYGETGTGKDLAARTIHDLSGLKGTFVPVNCGAIPEQLLESEFFGVVKGAFSGAYANREGYLAAANNGTLFLDEIGDLPLHLQVKLLRAIENKMYTPVGGSNPKASMFRLIAATNRDLRQLVRDGKMRSDLYYRVHVLSLTLPPLRERMDDLPMLVYAWLQKRGVASSLPARVSSAMRQYNWPGNVRELHNFMDRYLAFGDSAVQSLGSPQANPDSSPAGADSLPASGQRLSLEAAISQMEERMIREALEQCHWRTSVAAGRLGIKIRALQRKMKKLNITHG